MRRVGRGNGERGITLLELAVAILVLALGSLAALRATDQARLSIGGAQDRMLAQLAVRNRAQALRLPPGSVPLPDQGTLGGRTIVLEQSSTPTAAGLTAITIVGRVPGGGGVQQVIYVD